MRVSSRHSRAIAWCVVLLVACAEQTADNIGDPDTSPNGARGGNAAAGAATGGKGGAGATTGGAGTSSGNSGGSASSSGTSGAGASNAGTSSGGTSSAGTSSAGSSAAASGGDFGDGGMDNAGGSSGGTSGATGGTSNGGTGNVGTGGSGDCTGDVTLEASADTYMIADAATTNYGTATDLWITRRPISWARRALVRFDLSGIPSSATVTSAELTLTVSFNSGQNKNVAVHRVQQSPARNWSESQATWNIFSTGNNWSAGGGDFTGGATDSAYVDAFAANGLAVTWDVTADAADFVQTPGENFGWLLKDTLDPSGDGEAVSFASRSHGTSAWRPKLTVEYCE